MNLLDLISGAAVLLTLAGIIFKAGRIESKMRENQAQNKKDLDGIGMKSRKMAAEIILLSKERQDFDAIVRRLLG